MSLSSGAANLLIQPLEENNLPAPISLLFWLHTHPSNVVCSRHLWLKKSNKPSSPCGPSLWVPQVSALYSRRVCSPYFGPIEDKDNIPCILQKVNPSTRQPCSRYTGRPCGDARCFQTLQFSCEHARAARLSPCRLYSSTVRTFPCL